MTEFPVEYAPEQQTPVVPEDGGLEPSAHGDDVDPAEAYEADRIVSVDEHERP